MGDENEEFEFRLRAERESRTAPAAVSKVAPAVAPKKAYGAQDILGTHDAMASLATGAAASVAGGLAGIGGALLPGPQGQGRDVSARVQDALTYKPRTKLGGQLAGAAAYPFEKLAEGADVAGAKVTDVTGSPLAGTYANTLIQSAPIWAGRAVRPAVETRGVRGAAERTGEMARNEVRDATYETARGEGYVFPTSATNDSFLSKRVEGTGGRQLVNQETIIGNQKITNKVAVREAGLPENTALTPGRLEARRAELAEPYRQVAALDPASAADLQKLREVRAEATKLYAYYDRSGNPKIEKKAQRLMDQAEILEKYLEDAAQNAGKPELVNQLRQARKEIAKTFDIERALNEGSADISAAKLGAMLDKGKPLSGGLETIAKTFLAFRPYMADAVNLRNPGVDRTRSAIGLATNATGLHGGIGWLAEGVPLASGPARSLALSDMFQNSVGKPSYGPGSMQSLLDLLTQPETGVLASGVTANRRR